MYQINDTHEKKRIVNTSPLLKQAKGKQIIIILFPNYLKPIGCVPVDCVSVNSTQQLQGRCKQPAVATSFIVLHSLWEDQHEEHLTIIPVAWL